MDSDNSKKNDLQETVDRLFDQEETHLLMKLLGILPIGVVWFSEEGRVIFANSAAAEMYGYSVEEFSGGDITREMIIHPDDLPKISQHDLESDEARHVSNLPIRGIRKTGSSFYQEIDVYQPSLKASSTTGCLIINRHIPEQSNLLQAEDEERTLADALISSSALLSSSLHLDDVLEKILELVGKVVPHDSANIMLINGEFVQVVRARGYKTKELHDFTMNISSRICDMPSLCRMTQNGLPLVIPDTRLFPDWKTAPEFNWILSYVGAPMRSKGKVIGVINLDSGSPNFFCEKDAIRLQAFADLAATAINNANLYEALDQKARETSALFKAATALLSTTSDISSLANQITQTVHQDFSTAHVAILLINETTGKLEQIAQAGYPSEQTHPLDDVDGHSLTMEAIKSQKAIYIEDTSKDIHYLPDSHLTRSEYDIPFVINNTAIGVLNLESPEINGFDEQARKIIYTYAKRAALALENALLIESLQKREFQMTLINELTQISLKTTDLKDMLTEQIKILFETLLPDGIIISFSHPTLRRIMNGLALAADQKTNELLQNLTNDPEFSTKLAHFSEAVVTDDSRHQSLKNAERHNPFKAFILHPLMADGIYLGSAVLGYFNPRSFEKKEVDFYEQIIDQVALAVSKNMSIAFANDRAKEAENLRVAASTLTSTLNLQEVFERIIETATNAIPTAEKGLLFLFDEQKHIFHVRAQYGFSDPAVFTIQIGAYEGMAGKTATEKKALLFQDITQEKSISFSPKKQALADQKCWITAPLMQHEKVYGVLELCAAKAFSFTEDDVNVLVSFADTVTAAIQNAQLHTELQQIAITDILTGLYNRRGFEELGQREIHRSIRTSAPLSMLLVDVDYLKNINDTYGHTAGDDVIKKVANCCKKTFRQIDLITRFGGDEFAIILPDTPQDHAREAAERLRKTIETAIMVFDEQSIPLSASIGVASFDKNMNTIHQLFECADRALYSAKKRGRNSTVSYSELDFTEIW
ncbi:diguanylate cyclase [Leptolinea tardivitalis]|uniref:Diguanylate cyclase n=1 Tax=Leptolinea tardivitalis TaxID=229920 RepID=A0A0N8GL83_9CHLR|nr:diguanylate cyclase [Leptolinea tardivitalis]KPL71778.1 hypothetical protein ADM99_10095 [Leptolinea tardivitalis]GAP20154.1 protein containing PAS domain S-box [Leptolinea tardivitalis]